MTSTSSHQQTEVFGQQVEHLCQHLLGKDSVPPTEEAQAIINSLIHTLVLLENHWMAAQEAGLKVRGGERIHHFGIYSSKFCPALFASEISHSQYPPCF